MKKQGLILAVCACFGGSSQAGTLDAIKDAGVVLLAEKEMDDEKKKCEDNPDVTKMACDNFSQKTWDKLKAETDEVLNGASNAINSLNASKFYFSLGKEDLTIEAPNGFEMEQRQNVGRIGYQIDEDWAVEFEMAKVNEAHDFNHGKAAFYTWSDQSIWVKKSFMTEERFQPFARVGIVQMKEKGSQADIDLSPFHPDGSDEYNVAGWNWESKDTNIAFGVGAEFAVNEMFGIRWDTSWAQRDNTDLQGNRIGGSDKHIKTGLTGVYRF